MSGQGFDTWVLEVRGAGLSAEKMDSEEAVPVPSGTFHRLVSTWN